MNHRPAKEVRDLASTIISQHHAGLMTVPVLYLFTDSRETVAGKEALANHKKVGGAELFFLARACTADEQLRQATTGPLDSFATDPAATVYDSPDGCFLVTVWESGWRHMAPAQRLACVDHELCHLDVKQTPTGNKRVLVPHDVEEFVEILDRHGAWMPNLDAFIDDAETGQLSIEEGG